MNMAHLRVIYKVKDGKVFARGQGDPRWRVTYVPLDSESRDQWDAAVDRASQD